MELTALLLLLFGYLGVTDAQQGTVALCDPETYLLTVGGPVVGAPCVFPFTYQDTVFYHCTNSGYPAGHWCATSDNYPRDREWGQCPDTVPRGRPTDPVRTDNGLTCVFPFTYKGRLLYSCTDLDSVTGRRWCSSTRDYSRNTWGFCQDISPCFDSFNRLVNKQRLGGGHDRGVTVREHCQQRCLCNPACIGYEWQKFKRECWQHTGVVGNLRDNDQLDFYVRTPCTPPDTESPPVCEDTFRAEPNTHALGGKLEVGANDLDTCERSCVHRPSCVAFDLDENPVVPECFLHTDVDYAEMVQVGQPRVTHYTRQPCHTRTRPGFGCTDTFERYTDTHASGGRGKGGLDTVSECSDECLKYNNCTAFDFAPTGAPRCYLLLGRATRSPELGVDHYARIPCANRITGAPECVNSYRVLNNRHGLGGVFTRAARSATACQTRCNAEPTCVAIDFDKVFNECYQFFNKNYRLDPASTEGVDHYMKLGDCAATTSGQRTTRLGDCARTYQVFRDTLVFGGTESLGVRSVEECESVCDNHPQDCLAYDFDTHQVACWVHTDPTSLLVVNTQATGVNHYRRTKCEASCEETFSTTFDRSAGGAIRQPPTVNTPVRCRQQCVSSTSTCYGLDFDKSNNLCWLHLASYTLRPVTHRGVDNHRRDFSCTVTSTGSGLTTRRRSGCEDVFREERDTHAYGGIIQEDITSLDSCRFRCLSQDTGNVCHGFDFSFTTNGCWLYYGSGYDRNPARAPGINHYVRQFNCTGTTLRAAVGPTTPAPALGTCPDRFIRTANRHAPGGTVQLGSISSIQCASRCLQSSPRSTQPLCWGYDHMPDNGQCWLHLRMVSLSPAILPGVDNYRRVFTCIPLPDCLDNFQQTPNNHALNGEFQHGDVTSPDRCAAKCRQTERGDSRLCYGFDFITEGRTCWLHFSNYTLRQNLALGVVNHRRIFTCP